MVTNPAFTPEEAQAELRSRLRSYFIKVVALLIASIAVVPLLSGVVLKAMNVERAASISAGLGGLSMLFTVSFAWYLVFTTWRCPACNANIYWLVSWNMSAFAAGASKTCPKCNMELFKPRSGRFVLIIVAIAVMFGVIGALMAAGAAAQKSKQKQPDVTQPAPPPLPPG